VGIESVPAVVATYNTFVGTRDVLRAAISLHRLSDTPATLRSCEEARVAVGAAAEAYDNACQLAWTAATAATAATATATAAANVVHNVPAIVPVVPVVPAPVPDATDTTVTAVPSVLDAAQRRATRLVLNADRLDRCPNLSHYETANLLTRLGLLWANTPLPGYGCLVAYGVLRNTPVMDPRLPPILRAVLHLMYLTKWYHPDGAEFGDELEHRNALQRVTMLVIPLFPERMTASFLPPTDPLRPRLEERIRAEERRAEERRAEERRRQAEEQRRQEDVLAFEARMRDDAVVFTRDPEGSVDLRAFARDVESVHRSSVQSATEHSIGLLLDRDVPLGQDTLAEIGQEFPTLWRNDREVDRALHEIATDFLDTIAFSVRYGDVLDRVWAFIRAHTEKNELVIRLGQEVVDGYGTCANGKMARLVNVLRGYDETLILNPPKEAFQEKMARLRVRPVEERGPAAAALFEEYGVAEGERGAWLEALAE